MGSPSSAGRTDAGPNRTTASKYTAPKAIGVDKFGNKIMSPGNVSQIDESGKQTYDFGNFQNKKYKEKQGGPLILKPLEPLFDIGSEKTRTFFTDKVLSSNKSKKNIGYTKDEFSKLSEKKQEEVYKGYLDNRLSNKTDAYGNTISQNDNDNTPSQTIIKKTAGGQTVETTAPTEAELSQSAAADAEEYDLRKTKKRGRSMNTLTSSQGVTDDKLTLGKKSLLGS
jgi:hypothetical protein